MDGFEYLSRWLGVEGTNFDQNDKLKVASNFNKLSNTSQNFILTERICLTKKWFFLNSFVQGH
jgi:hypothetical protein